MQGKEQWDILNRKPIEGIREMYTQEIKAQGTTGSITLSGELVRVEARIGMVGPLHETTIPLHKITSCSIQHAGFLRWGILFVRSGSGTIFFYFNQKQEKNIAEVSYTIASKGVGSSI